jgi:prepilin-type N-terminal cleavage/methylation domain-containing protein
MTYGAGPGGAQRESAGFSLIELMVATVVLTVGLLSLLGAFTAAASRVGQSSLMLIAREKAREAVESVHSARDTGGFTWPMIRNIADGGMFLGGEQLLREAGDDGIVNTVDDGSIEKIRRPGPNGVLGDGDDEVFTLTNFRREIRIEPLNYDGTATVNPNLRRITVRVRYRVNNIWRDYQLVTFISSFS